ncbi:hypothetical protein SORBI_3007G154901 [Sorghum bicolor]|uniref:Alpha-carbonic anhydrase domain-containing protein n=1 Tax=Sorghum bicolor TaxID=4558 RepID=A0A1Z5RB09_SORBI|nr:hypothetical protein SORBI_3007G154901 [Sorghum bicolor]
MDRLQLCGKIKKDHVTTDGLPGLNQKLAVITAQEAVRRSTCVPKPAVNETSGAQRTATSMGPGRHTAVGALLAAALLLSAAVPGARAQGETGELFDQDEDFSYLPGADNGPENWGKIKAEWANCSVGRMQSPIDLSDERAQLVQSLGYLNTSSPPSAPPRPPSSTAAATTSWYDLELHLVHQTVANKTAVIGVLYEIGPIKDPFLHKLEPYIKHIKNTKDQPKDVGISHVDEYQVKLLRDALQDGNTMNARPLQEVNNRDISIFRPKAL